MNMCGIFLVSINVSSSAGSADGCQTIKLGKAPTGLGWCLKQDCCHLAARKYTQIEVPKDANTYNTNG